LAIPFVAPAVVVYLSLFPMLWLAPFALPTRGELRTFARAIAWMIVVAGIGFLALPSEPAHSVARIDGPIGSVFRFADAINLRYNMLPSLHVAMAMGCAAFYSAHGRGRAKLFWWTWSAAIAVSTLLTHQHHVVDVVTGVALGVGISTILGRRSLVTPFPAS
jgi:membrane-associated phospholipid phosphatase